SRVAKLASHAWHLLICNPIYRRHRSGSAESPCERLAACRFREESENRMTDGSAVPPQPRNKRMKLSGAQTHRSAQGVLDGSCMDCGVDTMARGEYYALKN